MTHQKRYDEITVCIYIGLINIYDNIIVYKGGGVTAASKLEALLQINGSFRCQGPVTHVRRGSPRGISNNSRKAACEQQVRRLVTRGSADGHRYHNNN